MELSRTKVDVMDSPICKRPVNQNRQDHLQITCCTRSLIRDLRLEYKSLFSILLIFHKLHPKAEPREKFPSQ